MARASFAVMSLRATIGGLVLVLVAALVLAWPWTGRTPAVAVTAGPVVGTAPSLTRLAENDLATRPPAIELWAARGEYESFQIAVSAPGAPLTTVDVAVSDLSAPDGGRIPRAALTLYREHYVTVTHGSRDLGGPNGPLGAGRYADALIPFVDPDTGREPPPGPLRAVPFTVAAGRVQPIWVDVLVPATAAPGHYTGTFTVTSDQGRASGQVTLHVWDFALPDRPALKSAFSFGNGASGTRAQNVQLLRHRLSPIAVAAGDETALIDTHGLTAGSLGLWSEANHADCERMQPPPDIAEIRTRVARRDPRLFLYNYTADEIGDCAAVFPLLKAWARHLHAAGVRNLVTMPPTPPLFDDGSGSGQSAVDIWVLLPHQHDRHGPAVAAAMAKGDDVWSYNALVQDDYSPKWLIDFSPVNFRIQPGFISQSLGLTGLLYWKVDRWSADPWHDVNNLGVFARGANYPGEGMLVYPGAEAGLAGVAPSMRLKWLRDGVDDYDYVELLRTRGRGEWTRPIVRRVAPDWKSWTRDAVAIERARRELGDELHLLARVPGEG